MARIFFDMDGVLADFSRGVREMCGIEPPDQSKGDKAADDDLFMRVSQVDDFYLRLEPIEGMLELFDEVRSKHGDDVQILTGVPKPEHNVPQASDNKREWVRRYISGDVTVYTVRRKEKQDYAAGKDCYLIDDFEKNILEWEAAGGTGIMFESAERTRAKLIELGLL